MRDKLTRDSLRAMDVHERWARQQGQSSAAPDWYQKQFDRRVPGRKTRTQVVGHTLLGGPRERDVQAAVEKFARDGWIYVARTEKRALGLSPYTLLTFQLGPRGQQKAKGKRRGCLGTLALIVGVLVITIVLGVLLLGVVALMA